MSQSETPVIDIKALRRSCATCSLTQLCLPATIGTEDMARLDDIVKRRSRVARGGRLYRQGDRLEVLFAALGGAFKTTAISPEGDEQVIGFHLPGELIGLDGIGSGRFQCDAVALEDAEVCEVPFERLESLAAQIPGLQRQLLRIIGRGMDRDQSHLEMLGRKQAGERVALFLHSLSERYRILGQRDDQFSLPMAREEIASYLGMVIETVSRTLTRLRDDGLIAVRGRQVRILDPGRLREIAHGAEALRDRA
ncbi:MAG TPA: helix-turn-helix domain-containing protein [Xanthomonadaceae bacterium]|nr:helix-turn-helix domain-containing protein [Xanthomonadaceae bacterium]